MFNRKWVYSTTENGCLGVLVENQDDLDAIGEVFNEKRNGKVTNLTVSAAKELVQSAKESIKKEDKEKSAEKPKRKRRTKAEIEADEAQKNNS